MRRSKKLLRQISEHQILHAHFAHVFFSPLQHSRCVFGHDPAARVRRKDPGPRSQLPGNAFKTKIDIGAIKASLLLASPDRFCSQAPGRRKVSQVATLTGVARNG